MKEKIMALVKEIKPQVSIDETTLLSNGILDSIELVTLLSDIEEAFGILIPSEEIRAENFKTIFTIEELVKKYQ